jgi:hypothetical protein
MDEESLAQYLLAYYAISLLMRKMTSVDRGGIRRDFF